MSDEKRLGTCDDLQDVKHPYDSFERRNWQPSEPVASPQATRHYGDTPKAENAIEEAGRILAAHPELAAQPAAGTTPCKHECGFDGVHQICQCVECGHEWPNKESTGATPQAERPRCNTDMSTSDGIKPCGLSRGHGGKHIAIYNPRAVAPVETPQRSFQVATMTPIELLETIKELGLVTMATEDGRALILEAINEVLTHQRESNADFDARLVIKSTAPVETRLTAEQFYSLKLPKGPINDFMSYEIDSDETRDKIFKFAEAFRDKSEAELRAKLAEQTEGLRLMTEIAGHRQGEWDKAESRAEAAEAEAAALRERERTKKNENNA